MAKSQADLEKEEKKAKANKGFDKLTDDGKKHKQGDVIAVQAFGVTIETKF